MHVMTILRLLCVNMLVKLLKQTQGADVSVIEVRDCFISIWHLLQVGLIVM